MERFFLTVCVCVNRISTVCHASILQRSISLEGRSVDLLGKAHGLDPRIGSSQKEQMTTDDDKRVTDKRVQAKPLSFIFIKSLSNTYYTSTGPLVNKQPACSTPCVSQ